MKVGTTIVMLFMLVIIFAALMAFLPVQFRASGISNEDKLAIELLTINNMIVYSTSASDTTFYGYTSLEDAPGAPQWNITGMEDDYLEIWWGSQGWFDISSLEARHTSKGWLGNWKITDYFRWTFKNGSQADQMRGLVEGQYVTLPKESMVQAWDNHTKGSAFYLNCKHISASIVFSYNNATYTDIGDAFDHCELRYALSYDWNPESTGLAVLSVISNLLSFKGLGLGIPGAFGNMVEFFISALFYVATIWVAYKIIAGLIPFVSGGGGGT